MSFRVLLVRTIYTHIPYQIPKIVHIYFSESYHFYYNPRGDVLVIILPSQEYNSTDLFSFRE